MTLRDEICAEALTWLGTPYHHLACLKGIGVDCGRLLEGIAKATGRVDPHWKPGAYSPEHHFHRKEELYKAYFLPMGCVPVAWEAIAPGVILTFRVGHVVSHSGIMMPDYQIVHAVHRFGVIMHSLQMPWVTRHDQAYDFPPRLLQEVHA